MESGNPLAGAAACQSPFVLTPSDEWFAAVDGQTVTCRNSDWRIQVFGIHNLGGRCWFQVGLAGPQMVMGTFEAPQGRPMAVLDALSDWLEESTDDESVKVPILL